MRHWWLRERSERRTTRSNRLAIAGLVRDEVKVFDFMLHVNPP